MSEAMRVRNENIPYLISFFIQPFVFDVLNEVLAQSAPSIHIQVPNIMSGFTMVMSQASPW
eukprot:3106724-Rhodomonas_salina.4